MTVSYEDARREVEEALGWTVVRGNAITLGADTLRALLLGPLEPSEEDLVFDIMTDPAYLAEVRDEQQTWLAEHIVQIIQKARRA